jgi:hypothetical protein
VIQTHNSEYLRTEFEKFKAKPFYHWAEEYNSPNWFYIQDNHHDYMRPISPLVHHATQFYQYRDYCIEKLPNEDAQMCGMIFAMTKKMLNFE